MSSGVQATDECQAQFKDLKSRKLKYIIYGLNKELTEIVVLNKGTSQDYDEFLKELPEKECRWAVYDLEFEKDGAKRNKICFISWSPDDARIKQKMVSASSRDALKRTLDGIGVEIQGTDPSEVSYETVKNKALTLTR